MFKDKRIAKYCWDEEMMAIKQASIDTHMMWIEAGKPRSGPHFDIRNKARYKYRFRIRESKMRERTQISLSLQKTLCDKNKTNFWKSWKSKFKNPPKNVWILNCKMF